MSAGPHLKHKWSSFLERIGNGGDFVLTILRNYIHHGVPFREFSKQCFRVGNQSLPLIAATGFILGLVMTMQSGPTLAKFGAESLLPGMVGLSIIREIGPVIVSLIIAGKVGSGIGAELASMRVTEQLDAMEVSGANPLGFVVMTRVLAVTLMLPLLVMFADTLSLVGAFLSAHAIYGVSPTLFIQKAFDVIHFSDLIPTVIKLLCFGFSIGVISAYNGYHSRRGTEGVGEAANISVFYSSLSIFIIDLLAVQLTQLFT